MRPDRLERFLRRSRRLGNHHSEALFTMANFVQLLAIEEPAGKRILRTGRFPVFAGDDPTAPTFVCGGCNTPLIAGIPAGGVRTLVGMADGVECIMCNTVRAVPRQ